MEADEGQIEQINKLIKFDSAQEIIFMHHLLSLISVTVLATALVFLLFAFQCSENLITSVLSFLE